MVQSSPVAHLLLATACANVMTEPHYRVTALTTHPAEALAQHLVDSVITVIRLPLSALFLRSLAHSFLASAGPSSEARAIAVRLKGDVYPLETWFGGGFRAGGWRGVGDYAGKMALVLGLEMAIGQVVWQLGFGAAWWAGRRWFLWGRL